MLLATAGAVALLPAAAPAATFTVTSTADETDAAPGNGVCATAGGACTLRAAAVEANALPDEDRIVVPAGTYVLGSSLPLTRTVTVQGAGARATVLDGPAGTYAVTISNGGTRRIAGLAIATGGGGVNVVSTDVTFDGVAVRDHVNTGSAGGGIRADSGSLTLLRSTVSGNRLEYGASQSVGGGISLGSTAALLAVHSTISANVAIADSSSFGGGIGLYAGATAVLRHVTLSGSSANVGGNLHVSTGATANVTDSILADGIAGFGPNCFGVAPVAGGRNLDTGTSCGFGAGHLSSTPALLEPLGDHGGPTDTRPPTLASPARDAATACDPEGTDQRGALVPAGPACDLGAAELGADLATTLTASRAQLAPGGDLTYVARAANEGADPASGAALELTPPAGAEVVLVTSSAGTCAGTRCELGTLARGASATMTVVVRAPATGPLTATVRATSAVPDPDPADDAASLTTAVDAPAPGPTPPVATPQDTTAPVLGALRAAGRVRRNRTATLATTLSEPARLTVTVDRLVPGRRVGTRCRTGRRTGRRCTITRRAGSVTRTAARGAVRFTLPAKLRAKALALGRHRVTVVAVDAAGNRSRARTLVVTVGR